MRLPRIASIALFVVAASIGSAGASQAQSLSTLPRATSTTGLNDSTLIFVADSARRSRAAVAGQFRKMLSLRAFDSLMTGNLRLSSQVNGSATWATTQTFASGQRVDSATGASRAQILTTARTIGGTSFNGSANIVPGLADSATGSTRAAKLTTARTIGGVSFDGSANIIPDSAKGAQRASGLVGSPAIVVSSCTGCGSSGGIAWVRDTMPGVTGATVWGGACWADSLNIYVALSGNGVANGIATSTNGTAFTAITDGNTVGKNKCVWASKAGLIAVVGVTGNVQTSPDGVTFTTRAALSGNTNSWQGVAYAPTLGDSSKGRLVAVAASGTRRIMYSDNGGVTWVFSDSTSTLVAFTRVVWADSLGKFFAAASAGSAGKGNLFYSTNGIAWTGDSVHTSSQALAGIAWSPELKRLVVVTNSATLPGYYSNDGLTWRRNELTGQASSTVGWVCGARFVAEPTNAGGFLAQTSTDGISWAVVPMGRTANAGAWTDFAYSAPLSQFIALGGSVATGKSGDVLHASC